MDNQRKKELKQQYREMKTYMGVYQVTNTVSGKIFIATSPNLKNRWVTVRMHLDMGMHPNSELQRDWNELGADNFTYEVLEEKEVAEDTDTRWELRQMEKEWLEKLQPYGDRGYNKPPRD
ncbi:MAG: GIY-YIG nuclease family protein [Firmicutes bacterium]|mgnify:FL=1|nr:GIY-YIG nuclease family protein [Bacillota bacterium]